MTSNISSLFLVFDERFLTAPPAGKFKQFEEKLEKILDKNNNHITIGKIKN